MAAKVTNKEQVMDDEKLDGGLSALIDGLAGYPRSPAQLEKCR
jgi:hypothetical protein